MFIERLCDLGRLSSIGATSFANKIAISKGNIVYFLIHKIKLPAAHILKQEALSVGGDFIVQKDMILSQNQYYDGILIATLSQLNGIINKCLIQPFGLEELAKSLQTHIDSSFARNCSAYSYNEAQIMGVVNLTSNSFYKDSRVSGVESALTRITTMIDNGANIIDIGGASTRPGSSVISHQEEMENIKDSVLALRSNGLLEKALFSIDSYNYDTIRFSLECGFHIINDVNALSDVRIMQLAKEYDCNIIIMHNSLITPTYGNVVECVDKFFSSKIDALEKIGVARNRIILDIGFGFGKDTSENLALIKAITHLKHFGLSILVGASRKHSIGEITGADVEDRLGGTIALHQIALQNGANIIRCHDVLEHRQMMDIVGHVSRFV